MQCKFSILKFSFLSSLKTKLHSKAKYYFLAFFIESNTDINQCKTNTKHVIVDHLHFSDFDSKMIHLTGVISFKVRKTIPFHAKFKDNNIWLPHHLKTTLCCNTLWIFYLLSNWICFYKFRINTDYVKIILKFFSHHFSC
jgi:hypothetical protein